MLESSVFVDHGRITPHIVLLLCIALCGCDDSQRINAENKRLYEESLAKTWELVGEARTLRKRAFTEPSDREQLLEQVSGIEAKALQQAKRTKELIEKLPKKPDFTKEMDLLRQSIINCVEINLAEDSIIRTIEAGLKTDLYLAELAEDDEYTGTLQALPQEQGYLAEPTIQEVPKMDAQKLRKSAEWQSTQLQEVELSRAGTLAAIRDSEFKLSIYQLLSGLPLN